VNGNNFLNYQPCLNEALEEIHLLRAGCKLLTWLLEANATCRWKTPFHHAFLCPLGSHNLKEQAAHVLQDCKYSSTPADIWLYPKRASKLTIQEVAIHLP
jgi:hypothetical protein